MTTLHPIFANILDTWQSAPSSRQLAPPAETAREINQSLGSGTVVAKQNGMNNRRCYVTEYHGNNRATFECGAVGHAFKAAMFRKAPNGKLPAEAMIEKFARYWSKGHAGAAMECPVCRKAALTSAQGTDAT